MSILVFLIIGLFHSLKSWNWDDTLTYFSIVRYSLLSHFWPIRQRASFFEAILIIGSSPKPNHCNQVKTWSNLQYVLQNNKIISMFSAIQGSLEGRAGPDCQRDHKSGTNAAQTEERKSSRFQDGTNVRSNQIKQRHL